MAIGLAFGQNGLTHVSPNFDLARAMARLKAGELVGTDVHDLGVVGAVQAVPDLKKQFALTQDPTWKGAIASALVKLGDKDAEYWDYLAKGAEEAIGSDAPPLFEFDIKGRLVPGAAPNFVAWAKSHNLSLETATQDAMLILPGRILFLGQSGDPRAIPLLRRALSSPNYLTQSFAADGLADLNDKASIETIISVCRRAPADSALVISSSLARFDDPRAQAAAKEFRAARDAKNQ